MLGLEAAVFWVGCCEGQDMHLPSLQSFEGQVGGASLTSPLVKSPPTLPHPPWDQGCWALATLEILEAFQGVPTRLRMQS